MIAANIPQHARAHRRLIGQSKRMIRLGRDYQAARTAEERGAILREFKDAQDSRDAAMADVATVESATERIEGAG